MSRHLPHRLQSHGIIHSDEAARGRWKADWNLQPTRIHDARHDLPRQHILPNLKIESLHGPRDGRCDAAAFNIRLRRIAHRPLHLVLRKERRAARNDLIRRLSQQQQRPLHNDHRLTRTVQFTLHRSTRFHRIANALLIRTNEIRLLLCETNPIPKRSLLDRKRLHLRIDRSELLLGRLLRAAKVLIIQLQQERTRLHRNSFPDRLIHFQDDASHACGNISRVRRAHDAVPHPLARHLDGTHTEHRDGLLDTRPVRQIRKRARQRKDNEQSDRTTEKSERQKRSGQTDCSARSWRVHGEPTMVFHPPRSRRTPRIMPLDSATMSNPAESLTVNDVRHVARLARLAMAEDHLPAMRDSLVSILGHIAQLQAVDTKDLEPMAQPLPMRNRLRADEPGATLSTADVLANAPKTEGDFIAVPKVLGGDSA